MFGNNEYGQLGIENNKTNVNIPTAITVLKLIIYQVMIIY